MVDTSQTAIGTHIHKYGNVYINFSGGKDSLVVARLCEPWRERVSLTWLNTGHHPVHMVEFVRAYGNRFRLIELTPADDLMEVWKVHGRPAPVPFDYNIPFILQTGRCLGKGQYRWMPFETCCTIRKHVPLRDFLASHDSRPLVITGHRLTDAGLSDESFEAFVDGIGPVENADMLCPILDWTLGNVMDFLAREGVRLPFQYDEGIIDSLDDCGPCTKAVDPKRLAFLDRHYPDDAMIVRETLDQWNDDIAG